MPRLTDDQCARLVLMRAIRTEAPAVHAFVAECGSLGALGFLLDDEAPDAVNAELCRVDMALQRDLDMLESGGARFITPLHDEWPSQLADAAGASEHYAPPLGLWVRGPKLNQLLATVTVLGTRNPTPRADLIAGAIADAHVARGASIVTPADPGIGAIATLAALDYPSTAHSAPVVTLPAGIDVDCSTREDHADLIARVLDRGGAVVSAHPVGTAGRRWHDWVAHRRLAVALGHVTVAIAGSKKSPPLAAARIATALGRPLYAVPGSVGTDRLLASGAATPAVDPHDIPHSFASAVRPNVPRLPYLGSSRATA